MGELQPAENCFVSQSPGVRALTEGAGQEMANGRAISPDLRVLRGI